MDTRTASLLACPTDSGQLLESDDGFCCQRCGRQYVANEGVLDLLPAHVTRDSLRENYNATYSRRPDHLWLRPLRNVVANLGNAYLYSWAARRIEQVAGGGSLTILDAACGDGMLRRWIPPRHRFVGVDFSVRPLLRAARAYSDIFVRGDLTCLPFANHSFDLVTSLQALQYLEHPSKAISEIARVLKPDGHFVLSVPNSKSIKYRIQGLPSIQLQTFDLATLRSSLDHYFDVTEIVTRGFWVPAPKISIHLSGRYSSAIGLSWTTTSRLRRL